MTADFRYALRTLLKTPAFTIVAVLSLALGIGANTAIFTVMDAIFLRPLPVFEPSRLATVLTTDTRNPGQLPLSRPNFEDIQAKNQVFSAMYWESPIAANLAGNGEAVQIFGEMVTGNYFDVLGIQPKIGRGFALDEDQVPSAKPVVILSHGLWQRRFGGDRALLGKDIKLNGRAFTVIGIAPQDFKGTAALGGDDFWVPSMMHRELFPFDQHYNERRALLFTAGGRLKPGIDLKQAGANIQTLGSQLASEYPIPNKGRGMKLMLLNETRINPNGQGNFLLAGQMMMVVVGVVLLIACANIANLLLVRASGRRKEVAIRLSMGASAWRLVRQLLAESLTLGLMGGVAGLAIGIWGRDLLWKFRPFFLANSDLDLSLNPRILMFTLGLSLLTGVLFGLAPAFQISRPNLTIELKERTNQIRHGGHWLNLRNLLVVGQVALSLVSLVGAGLLLTSLRNAQKTDPGFDRGHLLVLEFDPGGQGYQQKQAEEYYRQALQRVSGIPGVRSASLAANLPMGFGGGGFQRTILVDGQTSGPADQGPLVLTNTVANRYFETAGITLLRGRDFSSADREGATLTAIVNETMAAKLWPGQNPLGKRFHFFGDEHPHEIVGVARDSKYFNIGEDPLACVYIPLDQNYAAPMGLHVRVVGDPISLLGTVRREVQSIDPNIPLTNVSTASDLVDKSLWAPRMGAALLGVFGFLALALSAIGLHGVIAYSVSQRTSEIGIRMALGASPDDVSKLILSQGLYLVIPGLLAGLAASYMLTRSISALLFGVSATDPVTFAGTALLLLAVAMLASYLPARRASKVDPLIALRNE